MMHYRRLLLMLLGLLTFNSHATPQPIPQLDSGGHTSVISDIAFTPDGRYLISTGNDKTIRVWDWRLGKTVRFIRGHIGTGNIGKIFAMALSPDGRWLAVGGLFAKNNKEKAAIRLYDFDSGELIALLYGHNKTVNALAFSPDSKKLVSGGSNKVSFIWDIVNKRRLQKLAGHTDEVYAVAFTADNQRVVTGSLDHSLRLWDVEQGKLLHTLKGHSNKVLAVAVSRKGDLIASGGLDRTIRLWDTRDGTLQRVLEDKTAKNQIGSLSFSTDGMRLLSGGLSAPSTSFIWDVLSGEQQQHYQHDNIVLANAFTPDGRYAATAGGNKREIHIWDSHSGKRVQTLGGQGASIWSVGFAKNGDKIAWGKQKKLRSENNRGALQQQLTLSQENRSLGIPRPLQSDIWRHLPIKNNTLEDNRLTDLKRNPFTSQQTWQRAQTSINGWSLQPRNSPQGLNSILDIQQQGKMQASIQRDASSGYQHKSYTFTPDGLMIISGGSHGTLKLYQRNGEKIGDFIGHTGDVWAVAVSPNGDYLLSGSADQTVRLWRIDSQDLLLTLFTNDKDDWIAWTPQGYYTSSPNSDQLLGWHINRGADKTADFATAAQLRQHFYRPDIIDATLRLGSAKQAIAQAITQTSHAHFSLADLMRKGLPPKFVLSEPKDGTTVTQALQDITLNFAANAKAERLETYVNGRQVISRDNKQLPQQDRHQRTLTLPLNTGKNAIRIVAHNAIGQSEQDFVLTLDNADTHKKPQGRLFFVAIGISDYQDNTLDVNFTAKDAIAFQQSLVAQAQKSYREVKTVLLADGHKAPTAQNIQETLQLFRDATPNDTVVLFIAGHGINQQGNYYFLPQNAEKSGDLWRSSSIIEWNSIFESLAATQGKRIMFVDTCHAANSFNPRLLNDSNNKNIAVVSATDSQNASLEQRELGQGVFTYALLEGIAGKAAMSNKKQTISLHELDTYLSNRIPSLTNGTQTPIANIPKGFKDFAFIRL